MTNDFHIPAQDRDVDSLIDEVEQLTDCPIYHVRDDYIARKHANFEVPSVLDELFVEIDRLSTYELLAVYLGKKENWRKNLPFVFGRIFRMILYNMMHHNEQPKFHIYSCHDSTLMLLLYQLNILDDQWPPYTADLAFELYYDSELESKKSPSYSCHKQRPHPDQSVRSLNWDEQMLTGYWIRIIYLGKALQLKCLWDASHDLNMNSPDVDGNEFVPLSMLFEQVGNCLFASNDNGIAEVHKCRTNLTPK